MQAVILAAGKGTRMGDLTRTVPKPLLEVAGKTLLEWKCTAFPDEITDIVIVIGYLGEKIRERLGNSYGGKKITYVEQENPVGGTMDALLQAKQHLTGKFLVMMGDDIYATEDVRACLSREWALLAAHVPDVSVGGTLVTRDGVLEEIREHSHGGSGLVSTNLFVLDTRLFNQNPVPKAAGSTETGLPQTVLAASKKQHIPLSIIETTRWIQISSPADLINAEDIIDGKK